MKRSRIVLIFAFIFLFLYPNPVSAEPDQTELTLGVPVPGNLAGTGDVDYYQVSVAAGQHLFVVLDGTDNYDTYQLYLQFGSLPNPVEYEKKGELSNADQGVEISSTQAGTYYVMVCSTSGGGDYTLTASTSSTFPTLILGTAKPGNLQGTYDVKFYQVSVTAGQHLFVVLDGTDNYDTYQLYLRFGSLPNTVVFDDAGDLSNADQGVEITSTQAGTYYVMVRSTSGGGDYTLTASTSSTFPTLILGTAKAGNLQGTYDVKYYQVSVTAGQHLFVVLDGTNNYNSYKLYLRFGSLPSTVVYDDMGDLSEADQGVEITSTLAGTYYVMVRSTSGGGSYTLTASTSSTFPNLILGTAKAGNLQGTYDVKYYKVSVTAGQHLIVVLDGSDNYDTYQLYLRFGSLPNTVVYDDMGDLSEADQGVEITSTQAGTYYVMVRSTSGGGPYTITASTSSTFPTLILGVKKSGNLQGTYDVKYYKVSVTAGKHLFVVLDGTDNYDTYQLYLRFGALPTTVVYDDMGDLSEADQGVEISSTQAGTYYVMVRSIASGGPYTLTASTNSNFPTLILGVKKSGDLQGTYDVKYYQVSVTAGEHLFVVLDGTDNYNTYQLYLRFGSLPNTVEYDKKGLLPNADQGVEIASTKAGTYYVMVRSTSGGGNYTIERRFSPPTNLQASDGTYTTKVLLTWTASPEATSYKVYRATSAGGAKTLLGSPTGTSFTDKTALPGVTYYYWVKGYQGIRYSVNSAYNTGWRKLLASTDLKASDGTFTNKVQLTWTASDGASSYAVYRATRIGGTRTLLGSPKDTSFADTTAKPGVTYYYWVKAFQGINASAYSVNDTGWRKLSPPANLQASDGTFTTKVQLTWAASSGATSYKVYRATSAGGAKTLLGTRTVTSFADTTATKGVTYYYWVKAYRGTRFSAFSATNTGWRK